MIRRALVPLLFPLAAFAEDPFACVDPDVVDAFVRDGHVSARYSTGLPARAAALALPAPFELVGSMAAGSSTKVVYKSEQEAGAALTSSIARLEDAGWKNYSSERGYFRGFHSGSAPRLAHLCHASEAESLDILTRERSADTLLILSHDRLEEWRMCRPQPRLSRRRPLYDYLPDLEAPDDARLRENGSNGGGDESSATATVLTGMSRSDLLEHFNEQVRNQGWVADSDWSGGMTVGTVWTRRGRDDQLLLGTMRIAEIAEGVFNARFTVISASPGDYSDGRFSTSAPAS